EREPAGGPALARRQRLDQQDRRPVPQGLQQRRGHGVGRAGARGPQPGDAGLARGQRTMRVFETPGVQIERADAAVGGVSRLRTDVAGFVGIAQRGPLQLAVPLESYRQFQAWFGDTFENGYLAYCARAFFENGGRRLWAVRVASP